MDCCLAGAGGLEQRPRHEARIDHQAVIALQRRATDNAKPIAQAFAIQIAARQSGGPPRGVFSLQFIFVEDIACEIERAAALDIGYAEFAEPRRNSIDRQPRSPPGSDCFGLTNFTTQMYEGRIDLM